MAQRVDEAVISALRELLIHGQSEEVARLFLDLQQRGALPRGRRVLPWIKGAFGADLTKTLILAFAHQACLFCTKGLVSCERCQGKGHMDHAFVCEDCFGLGARACRFCNGMGWASWDFIPEGLRLLVLAERTKSAVDSIGARPPEAGTGTATEQFLGAVQTLLAINKDLGVLENTVVFSDKARPQSARERKMLDAMVHSAVGEAALARRQRMTAVKRMMAALETLSLDPSLEEDKRRFEKDRREFYRFACEAEPPFKGTFLRHPFLEDRVGGGLSCPEPGSPDGDPQPPRAPDSESEEE